MTDVRLTATNPEDSSVVPVACNSRGELLVEGSTSSNFPDGLTVGDNNSELKSDGSAKFSSDESNIELNNDYGLQIYKKTDDLHEYGFGLFSNIGGIGEQKIAFKADGSAIFAADVVIGSRNKQWMIVESNGLAHLVEQTRASTADLAFRSSYPPLRDIPSELTMVEQQLQKVMERLKMAPEAGWEVWDGSD